MRRHTFPTLYLNPLLPFLSHLPPPTAPHTSTPSFLLIFSRPFSLFFPDSRLPGQTVSPSSHPGGEGSHKGGHHRAGPGGRGLIQTHLADVSVRLTDQHAALIWNHTTTRTHTASPSAFSILISLLLKDANGVNGNITARLGSRSLFFRTEMGGFKNPQSAKQTGGRRKYTTVWLVLPCVATLMWWGRFFPSCFKGKVCESCRVKTTKKCQLMGRNSSLF